MALNESKGNGGMTDSTLKTRRMARWIALSSVLLLAAAAFCGPAEIGPSNWLFQVSLKNRAGASPSDGRQLLVLLPSASIRSEDDLGKYLAWCVRAHKSFSGSIRSAWDIDDIEFREPENANLSEKMTSFLRPGDSARDPSGAMSLVVTNVPGDGRGTFQLCLAERPLAPETATPAICITNLWVLSRQELLKRWEKALYYGKREEVFDEMGHLARSGRYRLPGGSSWEQAVEQFRKLHPELRPSVLFKNESGKPILVEVEDRKMSPEIPSGSSRRFPPSGERRRIAWRVRPADDPNLTDTDYDWASGGAYWDPEDTENVVVRLSPSSVGRELEKWPKISLTNTFDAAVHFRMEYGENKQPLDVPPRRRVDVPFEKSKYLKKKEKEKLLKEMEVRFIAESDEAERPWRRTVTIRRGQAPVTLTIELERKDDAKAASPAQPSAKPTAPAQKTPEASTKPAVPVQKKPEASTKPAAPARKTPEASASKPSATLQQKPSEAPAQPQNAAGQQTTHRNARPVGEKVDWPSSERITELINYFGNNACQTVMRGTKTDGDEFLTLANWQKFWKTSGTNGLERTFREAVAHVARCPGRCEACRERRSQNTNLGSADHPKTEVFRCIGSWAPNNQKSFCNKLIDEERYKIENLKEDPCYWWRFCTEKKADPARSAKAELSRFWQGFEGNGNEFGRFYHNVELGNPDFENYHKAIAHLPTFEERRRELFRMVILDEPSTDWGEVGVDKPSAAAVDEMIGLLDKSISSKEEGK